MVMAVTAAVDFDGTDFFRCERFRTTMLKRRCVERQAGRWAARSPLVTRSMSFLECRDCLQGRDIAAELGDIEIEKPRFFHERGKGRKKEPEMEANRKPEEPGKQCAKCRKARPADEFCRDSRTTDGLAKVCNFCVAAAADDGPGEPETVVAINALDDPAGLQSAVRPAEAVSDSNWSTSK